MKNDREHAPDRTRDQSSKTIRSPKGLISVNERPAGKEEGFKFERIGANKSDIKFTTPDATVEMVRAHIAVLRRWATFTGFGDGDEAPPPKLPRRKAQHSSDAGEFADRTYWATCVLKKLDDVERELSDVELSSDTNAVRRHALTAIYNALVLASEIHLLTVVDNEAPIATGVAVSRGLKDASTAGNTRRHFRQAREWKKWNAEAHEIWKRNSQLSRQAVAGLVKAKLRLEVKERTIAKRLRKSGTAG